MAKSTIRVEYNPGWTVYNPDYYNPVEGPTRAYGFKRKIRLKNNKRD